MLLHLELVRDTMVKVCVFLGLNFLYDLQQSHNALYLSLLIIFTLSVDLKSFHLRLVALALSPSSRLGLQQRS
ncbi:hypothetical protein Sjap_017324 [Stephania japonica]|uniref:Uncharacterized protein n=1 Tax=Stephania japonica TaxID=461633 RepID=A0AAP0I5Y9_9MAGN